MATVEVSHKAAVEVSYKAAGVRSSSKITDSYVASFPGLPHIITFSIHWYTYNTCCHLWPLSAIQCLALRRSAIIYPVLSQNF